MALIKEQDTTYGIKASYWKIEMVSINRGAKDGSCILKLYLNRETSKLENATYLDDKVYYIDSTVFDSIFEGEIMNNNTYKNLYEYIKLNDSYFNDAISDTEVI